MPPGQYYIVLEAPDDVVPLISYIALRSVNTICYVPPGRNMNTYERLVSLIIDFRRRANFMATKLAHVTNLITVGCDSTKSKKIKQAFAQFKPLGTRILLRPADKTWTTCLSKSLADSLVYWGVPLSIDDCKYTPYATR
jgi:hypothetical protein